MKRKVIFQIAVLFIPIVLLTGCFLFGFPGEFDNPLDPDFSGGFLEKVFEGGRRLYEERTGIAWAKSADVALDGSYMVIGDGTKPEIMKYNIAADSVTYLSLGENEEPIVDIAAITAESYVATKNAVYRVNFSSNTIQQVKEYADFEILFYDIDTTDSIAYAVTKEADDGNVEDRYVLRWYDNDGNELGLIEDDLYRDLLGFAVNDNYIFLASDTDCCINVVSQTTNSLVSQIFYNGSDMEQVETSGRNTYDSTYRYFDMNWDPNSLQMAAVIRNLNLRGCNNIT